MSSKKQSFFHGHEGFVFVVLAMVIAPIALAVMVSAQTYTKTTTSSVDMMQGDGSSYLQKSTSPSAPVTVQVEQPELLYGTRMEMIANVLNPNKRVQTSKYKISNLSEKPVYVYGVRLKQPNVNGDIMDFRNFGMDVNGKTIVLPKVQLQKPAVSWHVTAGPSVTPTKETGAKLLAEGKVLQINPGEQKEMGISAVIQAQSGDRNKAWTGAGRSGHAPTLTLVELLAVDGDFQPVKTELLDPERIPGPVILRAAKPSVSRVPLTSAKLMEGYQNIYQFKVSTDVPINWKQMQFALIRTAGVELGRLTLLKNGGKVDSVKYKIYARCGGPNAWVDVTENNAIDKTKNTTMGQPGCDRLLIRFQPGFEETVLKSPESVYSIKGNVFGLTKAGQKLQIVPTILTPTYQKKLMTGTVVNISNVVKGIITPELRIKSANPLQKELVSAEPIEAGFLWSDRSDPTHNAKEGVGISSIDWTDGSYLPQTASALETLTY